jgi:3-dehydroquinate synthase
VLVVGGGAVLDVVGFAAAVAHRGVRLIRVPSTTLSQADSGVGVKNGLNAFGKKNYLGTFTPPWAVLNDETLLTTLSDTDWRGGFSETVKVALVKDADLFTQIAQAAGKIRGRDMAAAVPIIHRSAQLHLEHIVRGGDPFELTAARPLDFGHWAAHKLEQMTGFTYPHGQAVAIGVALDVTYSVLAGYLNEKTADKVLATLHELGLPLFHETLADVERLWTGLEDFREHLGGVLTITLIRDIGRAVDVHRVERPLVEAALQRLAAKTARRPGD